MVKLTPKDRDVLHLFSPALDYRGPHIDIIRMEYYVNATFDEVASQPHHHARTSGKGGHPFVNEWAVFGPHGDPEVDQDPQHGGWYLDGRNSTSRIEMLLTDGGWSLTYADALKALRKKLEKRVEAARAALTEELDKLTRAHALASDEQSAWQRKELRPIHAAIHRRQEFWSTPGDKSFP